MASNPPTHDAPTPSFGRWQFGLASLMLWMTTCAVAFSFWNTLGPRVVMFIVAVSSVALLLMRFAGRTRPGSFVVIDMDSDVEAHVCQSVLRSHGIAATVVSEQSGHAFALRDRAAQIAVPAEQADQARELLEELAEGRDGG